MARVSVVEGGLIYMRDDEVPQGSGYSEELENWGFLF